MNPHSTSHFFDSFQPRSARDQQMNLLDTGLHSVQGAKTIISMVRNRRFVNRLIIGHNELGDEGCRHLFRFLCSEEGRGYDIQEISLNSNGIGDEGLLAIAEYLQDNKRIRELFLQNNALKGKPDAISTFVAAVNSSRLEILSLTMNKSLSDGFLLDFLSLLDASHLRELQLSAIGITQVSGKTIASYLSSHRCRLHALKLNGNSLGLHAIRSIVRAIKDHNYSLRVIELYANQLNDNDTGSVDGSDSSDSEAGDGDQSLCLRDWKDCETALKGILLRNIHLKREIGKQAIALLCSSRPLLLQSHRRSVSAESKGQLQGDQHSLSLPPAPEYKDNYAQPPTFRSLPPELQHYILSFLAPSLSTAQCIRIFEYASSVYTLPQLLPPITTLKRRVNFGAMNGMTCVPNPSSIEYSLGGTVWAIKADLEQFHAACTVDRCMGTSNALLCRREKEQLQYLGVVGCDTFELEPGEGAHAAREVYTLSLV